MSALTDNVAAVRAGLLSTPDCEVRGPDVVVNVGYALASAGRDFYADSEARAAAREMVAESVDLLSRWLAHELADEAAWESLETSRS